MSANKAGRNPGLFWDEPGLYTRAIGQGTQIHPRVHKGGLEAIDWLRERPSEIQKWLDSLDEEKK